MKRSMIGLLIVLGLSALACGLLDTEMATVTYEEGIPVDFEIDANEICPPDMDCDEDSEPAPEDTDLEPIEFSLDIDIPDATGNDNLRDISSRLRSLEITSIDYDVSDNDLTFDLPDLEIFIAPHGTEDTDDDDAVHLTTIPSVAAGEQDAGRADVIEANRESASEIFKELDFAALPKAQAVIKEGQPLPPSGSADVELKINIKITANPTD